MSSLRSVSIVMILTGLKADMEIIQYNESPSKQDCLHTVKLTVLLHEYRRTVSDISLKIEILPI